MQAVTTSTKEAIIEKFENQIHISDVDTSDWRIGIGSLQRASLLNVTEEIVYHKLPIEQASEVMFHFIAQGVKTCNMSKSNFNGIYLYR